MNVRTNIIKSLSEIAIGFGLSPLQVQIILDSWEGILPKVITLSVVETTYNLKKSHACKLLSKLVHCGIIKKYSRGKYLVALPKRRYSQLFSPRATIPEPVIESLGVRVAEIVPVESFFKEIQTKLNQEKSPFSDGRREDPKDPWVTFNPPQKEEDLTELNCKKSNEDGGFHHFISKLEIWNEPHPEISQFIKEHRERAPKTIQRFSELNCEKPNNNDDLQESISTQITESHTDTPADESNLELNCEKSNNNDDLQESISSEDTQGEPFLKSHYNNTYNNTLTSNRSQKEEYKIIKEYYEGTTEVKNSKSDIEMCELEIPDADWKEPHSDEEFEVPKNAVHPKEEFTIDLYGFQVMVTGQEALEFALAYEGKLKEYLNQPFLKIISGGYLCKSKRSYKNHVNGAAICKWNKFNVRRFIEAQFFLHDDWKGTAPSIKYITSVGGSWGSEVRYKNYCTRFKDDLDYFSEGEDNIERTVFIDRTPDPEQEMRVRHIAVAQNEACLEHYANQGMSEYETLKFLCVPGEMHLPGWFVEDRPTYHQLLKDRAWGELADSNEFCKKVAAKINHV